MARTGSRTPSAGRTRLELRARSTSWQRANLWWSFTTPPFMECPKALLESARKDVKHRRQRHEDIQIPVYNHHHDHTEVEVAHSETLHLHDFRNPAFPLRHDDAPSRPLSLAPRRGGKGLNVCTPLERNIFLVAYVKYEGLSRCFTLSVRPPSNSLRRGLPKIVR